MISKLPKRFQGEEVIIMDGEWEKSDSLALKKIIKWEVEKLKLRNILKNVVNNDYCATLLQDITHIDFINLTELSVSLNQIQTIEGLERVHMPQIFKLAINDNDIRSIRALKKGRWPFLKSLRLESNQFEDFRSLTQGWFPKLWILEMNDLYLRERANKFVNSSFYSKLQTKILGYLIICSDQFCIDRSIKGILQKKWQDPHIQ